MTTCPSWQPVVGYKGIYEVSEEGQIRSLKRRGRRSTRILKWHDNGTGYFFVRLTRNGTGRARYVHRLIARAFLGPHDIDQQVNHRDGNKKNNRISNLEYVTAYENFWHAVRRGAILLVGPGGHRTISMEGAV